jgi:hypothetical protein
MQQESGAQKRGLGRYKNLDVAGLEKVFNEQEPEIT